MRGVFNSGLEVWASILVEDSFLFGFRGLVFCIKYICFLLHLKPMNMYSFEKLECWQHARKLAVWTYRSTSDFPEKERFGLVSQMRKAAISVASNIAEGTSRKTAKDQAHFSTIAYGSAIELLNQLIITNDLNYLSNQLYQQGRELLERQTILISKLRVTQK